MSAFGSPAGRWQYSIGNTRCFELFSPAQDGRRAEAEFCRPAPRQRQAHRRRDRKKTRDITRSQSKARGHLPAWGCAGCAIRRTIRRSSSASSGRSARRATSRSPAPTGTTLPLRRALTEIYNLTTPSRQLLELLASRGAADLAPLLDRANAEQLKHYFNGWNEAHDVLDVLEEHASIRLTPAELVDSLRKIAPAPLLDRVEPGRAPRPSAPARRVGALHRARTRARRASAPPGWPIAGPTARPRTCTCRISRSTSPCPRIPRRR